MSTQQAKVKCVLSGDTIILTAVNNPRNERSLSLAYVTAPRLKRDGDENFAVESRDFIRRLLVGRVIQFRVLYTLPGANQRDYGTITLQDGRHLPEVSVAEGFVKLRDDAGKREESEEATALIETLRVLESRAKADEKGQWDRSTEPIHTSHELSDPHGFVQRWKGKPIEAIVEKVLSGDRLLARFMETPTKHVQCMLLIAGIRAPNTKRTTTSDGQEQPAEPLGDEAQDFVEIRLLQRKVTVHVLGVSPQNQLVGSVKHPNGDIAVFVLRAGLARCTDYHSVMLGQEMTTLRQSEKYAKDNRLGLFQGLEASKSGGGGESDATVSRVQTADALYIRYAGADEKRVNLSSVRQPKPSDPKQAQWAAESKEFMRKRLIGKHVKVSVDGKRPATEGYEEREMVTITQNGKNIALDLVENGYASVLRHRMDDTDRSPIYDDLLLAEGTAQQEGKGMWSPKPPETKQYVDYSESLDKAKRLLSLLSRQKRVPAVVDYVKGGSRFTLLIPRENAKLTFVLSGIQAPKSARNATETSEPFGKEAHDLANRRCQQRDVEIDVEDTDKVGGFIGKLYINRENFAKILLEEGFATVRAYSAEKSGSAAELFTAEQKAKEARKGLWHDWDPSKDAEDGDADPVNGADGPLSNGAANGDGATSSSSVAQAQTSKDYRDVVVTHVDPATCRLKIQQVSAATTGALSSLMSSFRKFHLSPSASTSTALPGPPKAGDVVAAKFSEDGEWYRARVRRNDRENKTAEVVYVDYGNSETQPWSALRSIGDPARFGIGPAGLKAQAMDAALSFVQFPTANSEYLADAERWLTKRLVHDQQLISRVDHIDQRDNTLWITLFNDANAGMDIADSVNAEVIEDGVGMVQKKPSRWEKTQAAALEGLRKLERTAKDEKYGMWEYGEIDDD